MRRANIGAERAVDGWDNFDKLASRELRRWDIREPSRGLEGEYDSAVAHHVLSCLNHHELVPALENIRAVLKPGGTLRVSDLNVVEGILAYQQGNTAWFPQDERIESIDARFCTWATWFGTHRSIFTPKYLREAMDAAGFVKIGICRYAQTWSGDEVIVDLDDRAQESIFIEGVAP